MTPFVRAEASPSLPQRDLPEPVHAVLTELGIQVRALESPPFTGPRRPVRRLIGGGVVVEVADTDAGRLRLRRELWGRRWARSVGIPTIPVLAADAEGAWTVAEWWRPAAPAGPAFLEDAVATALRIADSPTPRPGPPPAQWTSPRRAAPLRLARGLLGGVPTRLWLAARRAAAGLPQVPVTHGDYYHRNALWCPDRGGVHVVDWEYLGAGPRHGDLVRLWTLLPQRADRDELRDRILTLSPPPEHREIGVLALYLALRLLGENVKGARADRHRADLDHARAIQPEARELARALDAWPL